MGKSPVVQSEFDACNPPIRSFAEWLAEQEQAENQRVNAAASGARHASSRSSAEAVSVERPVHRAEAELNVSEGVDPKLAEIASQLFNGGVLTTEPAREFCKALRGLIQDGQRICRAFTLIQRGILPPKVFRRSDEDEDGKRRKGPKTPRARQRKASREMSPPTATRRQMALLGAKAKNGGQPTPECEQVQPSEPAPEFEQVQSNEPAPEFEQVQPKAPAPMTKKGRRGGGRLQPHLEGICVCCFCRKKGSGSRSQNQLVYYYCRNKSCVNTAGFLGWSKIRISEDQPPGTTQDKSVDTVQTTQRTRRPRK